MWEPMAERTELAGGEVRTDTPVEGLDLDGRSIGAVRARGERLAVGPVISSLPLRHVVALARPRPPADVRAAADGLRYRDFVCVALVLDGPELFPDNWIYVHEPGVRVARVQNFRAWSPWMVPDASRSCVGMEYV